MNGILVSHLDETVPIVRVVCRAKSSELTFFGAKFFQPHFLQSFAAPWKSLKRPCHNQTLPCYTHSRGRRGSSKLLGKWDQISATQYRATYPDGLMVQRTMRNDMVMMPWGRTKSGSNVYVLQAARKRLRCQQNEMVSKRGDKVTAAAENAVQKISAQNRLVRFCFWRQPDLCETMLANLKLRFGCTTSLANVSLELMSTVCITIIFKDLSLHRASKNININHKRVSKGQCAITTIDSPLHNWILVDTFSEATARTSL